MTVLTKSDPLRPAQGGLKGWLGAKVFAALPRVFGMLRVVKPILKLGSLVIVTRYDDVRDVFLRDVDFDTPYKTNIDILTDNEPFFLGMRDTSAYREDIGAMRRVFLDKDLARLGDDAEQLASKIVCEAGHQLEVVNDLVRHVTFDVFEPYIGIPKRDKGRLDVWATRLFAFQFTGHPGDRDVMAEVNELAPALRQHIDEAISARKAAPSDEDDVLGRCLALQSAGHEKFSDTFIRTQLLCMFVGGPPQIPMVAPQALEQLFRRPRALKRAQQAALANDDRLLWKIVREAMRFDPLAPVLKRVALRDAKLAPCLDRETEIEKGTTVLVAFSSAMMDSGRLLSPEAFNPMRQDNEYLHFGHGLHECFGRFMNEAVLARILKPLLKQPQLRRASGSQGRLTKRGIFSDRLMVDF